MNSNIDLEGLFEALLADCCPDLTKKGKLYLRNRVKNEGIGFLTVTLPSLGDAILESLETGVFRCPTAFERKGNCALPKHLAEGLLLYCFSPDGSLRPDYSADTLRRMLQLCMYMKKLVLPADSNMVRKATRGFLERNEKVGAKCAEVVAAMRNIASELHSTLSFPSVLSSLLCHPPRHTSGAVANKAAMLVGGDPVKHWTYRRSAESHGCSDIMSEWKDYYAVLPGEEAATLTPNRVMEYACVPKTATKVRVIGLVEADITYERVSLDAAMRDYLKYTTKSVEFRDQTINQKLALKGSLDGSWATIDSSAASDSVSTELVEQVLGGFELFDSLLATRCTQVRISKDFWKEETTRRLNIYSGMGDINCFAMLSFMMYLSSTAGIMLELGVDPRTAINIAAGALRIYGDDVVVRREYLSGALRGMGGAGFVVNTSKSCTRVPRAGLRHGIRRESCGVDYVDGNDITPLYLRVTGIVQSTKKGLRLRLRDDLRKTPRSGDGCMSVLKAERHARECVHANLVNLSQFWYDSLTCLWSREVRGNTVVEIRPPATAKSPYAGVCNGPLPEIYFLGDRSGITSTMVRNDYGLRWLDDSGLPRRAMRVIVPIPVKEDEEIDPLVGIRTRLLSPDFPEEEPMTLDLNTVSIPNRIRLVPRRLSINDLHATAV